MVTMRLHRKGVILAIVFALVFAILIFAVGYMTGMSRGMKIALKAPAVPKIAVPKVVVPKLPSATATTATATAGQDARPVAGGTPAVRVAIRVGVFPAEEDAKALVQRLAASKVTATISPMPTDAGPTLYLVLVGRYTSRREAAAAAAELERNEGLDTAVVPVP
jgi:cell division septation protein DedD